MSRVTYIMTEEKKKTMTTTTTTEQKEEWGAYAELVRD